MIKHPVYLVALTVFFLMGGCVTDGQITPAPRQAEKPQAEAVRPAYLIISVNEIHPEKMGPFKEAVRPIVQSVGGAELVAFSEEEDIQLLEGAWNFPGLLLIERFESMAALKKYWYSDEYAEAKKLREGFAEANFFLAIEGPPLEHLPTAK